MKIIAISYGTEGDSRPVAVLLRGLMDAGHKVVLLGDPPGLASAEALGVPTVSLPGDLQGMMQTTPADATGPKILKLVQKHTAAWVTAGLAEGPADLILCGGLTVFVGETVAESRGTPVIQTILTPVAAPTREFVSPIMAGLPLPRWGWVNRLTHMLTCWFAFIMFRSATNAARKEHGIPTRSKRRKGDPSVYGISPALLPRPADYPTNAVFTGQWVLPDKEYSPPPELEAFLAAGEKPIYVGFGSMAGVSKDLIAKLRDAIGDRRAIFGRGWSTVTDLPSNFFAVGDVPHTWLLPRCAMAIHHGGSGTTHSACAAGVPSIILPTVADQYFWARLMADLGIANHELRMHNLNTKKLRAAIAYADTPAAQERARTVGEKMRAEDGVSAAVQAIEAFANQKIA
jgi:sterol 3beta-glucosyltransferase